MKLKEGFLLHDVGEDHMAVATGEAGKVFNGLIRNNATGQFIFQQLQKDTTEEQLVKAMEEQFDAPQEKIAADVHRVVEQLKKAGFLDE